MNKKLRQDGKTAEQMFRGQIMWHETMHQRQLFVIENKLVVLKR